MNPINNSNSRDPGTSGGSSLSKGILYCGMGLVALVIGLVIVFKSTKTSQRANEIQTGVATASEPTAQAPAKSEAPTLPIVRPEPVAIQPQTVAKSVSQEVPVAVEPAVVDTNRNAKRLVADLVDLKPDEKAGITREQADKFKENMAQLIQQGPAGVPAIQEFLNKNIDSSYDSVEGGEQLGYSSLRAGMLDALKQIGGPEALGAMAEVIQTTAVPGEILEVAKNLEQAAPGQYSEAIVKAAKDAVEMSSKNQLGPNVEVGPAFKVIQSYSDPNPRALETGSEGQPGN